MNLAMNLEMRWLERKTGKIIENEHGWRDAEIETVLQYRQRHDENTATLWQDIPTVKEQDGS